MPIIRHFDRYIYFKKQIWSFWYTCSCLWKKKSHGDLHIGSEIKVTPKLHIFHLVAEMWTTQHIQHWRKVTLTLTPNEKSSGIYIKTNWTNQYYMWFDVQVPNDYQDKSSLHLSKEASGTDVTNVSVLTIELWQVIIYCSCGSQSVPFIIYRYIVCICSSNTLFDAKVSIDHLDKWPHYICQR